MNDDLAHSPEHYLGQSIGGRFRIDRLIGRGGSAWVYHATTQAGWEAAIKVLHSERPTSRLRFDREIRVLRVLPQSSFVPRYIQHGWVEDGRPFLAIEYIDGITLKESMKIYPRRTPTLAVELMVNLCRAFSGLHELGVAHRDVKPANVLLPNAGGISLIDFGLIRDAQGLLQLLEEEDPLQSPVFNCEIDQWLLAGTPEYMAPEQFDDALSEAGSPDRTDTWSDVYSLGVILFELLSGATPFPMPASGGQRSSSEYLHYARWRNELTDDDTPLCPGLDLELASILRKALHRNPRRRQRDARELGADLIAYLESGEGVLDESVLTIVSPIRRAHDTTERLPIVTKAKATDFINTEPAVHHRAPYDLLRGMADDTTSEELAAFAEESEPATIREPRKGLIASAALKREELFELDDEDSTLPLEDPPSSLPLVTEELPTIVDTNPRRSRDLEGSAPPFGDEEDNTDPFEPNH